MISPDNMSFAEANPTAVPKVRSPHFAAPRGRSSSDEWYTPDQLVSALGAFDTDPATSMQRGSQIAPIYYTKADDGLSRAWAGKVFINPPYGTTAGQSNQGIWAARAVMASTG